MSSVGRCGFPQLLTAQDADGRPLLGHHQGNRIDVVLVVFKHLRDERERAYFEIERLNIRSIFSLVASTADWLA